MIQTDKPGRQDPDSQVAQARERRDSDRYSLDEAFGHLKYGVSMLPCQFIDIGLSGCRIRLESPFAPGALAQVQIVLLIFGLVLHIDGVTQWARGYELGVRFAHPSFRSKNQLASLLTCLIDKDAEQVVQEVFSETVLDPETSPTLSAQASSPRRASAPTGQAKVPPTSAPPDPAQTFLRQK